MVLSLILQSFWLNLPSATQGSGTPLPALATAAVPPVLALAPSGPIVQTSLDAKVKDGLTVQTRRVRSNSGLLYWSRALKRPTL